MITRLRCVFKALRTANWLRNPASLTNLRKFRQRIDRHRNDIGHAPRRRVTYLAIGPLDALGKHVADDGRHPTFAIEDRRSRRAVIDDKAIFAFEQLQKRHSGKLPTVSKSHEAPFNKLPAATRIG